MKILWPIDVFEPEPERLRTMVQWFHALGLQPQHDVTAVYVASPGESQLSTAFDVPIEERYSAYPKRLLRGIASQIGLKLPVTRLRVITEPRISLKQSARDVSALALKERANMIALFTHSRSGLRRLVLGSFAETLVHMAQVPVFLVNPAAKPPRAIRRVLFATDLSLTSRKAFRKLLDMVVTWQAEILVFHVPQPSIDLQIVPQSEAEFRRVKRLLAQYEKLAATKGVRATTLLGKGFVEIARQILAQAQRHEAQIIATVAQTGPAAAALLGSVTRRLIRESDRPVLVLKV